MWNKGALVIYKTRPALVTEVGDKVTLLLSDGNSARVREKDALFLHAGPLSSLAPVLDAAIDEAAEREAWQLLEGAPSNLEELSSLIYGEWTALSAYRTYMGLEKGVFWSGSVDKIVPNDAETVQNAQDKIKLKESRQNERKDFLERLKKRALLEGDAQYMQDVEAFALGLSAQSRTLKDAGLGENQPSAHKLLLETGIWDEFVNPYPSRYGFPAFSAKNAVPPPSNRDTEKERADLTSMKFFAIDNENSNDADDALAIATENGKVTLFVSVADPASSVLPDSAAEKEARERGATLYMPDAVYTMLHEDALLAFVLGRADVSPALTFKLRLNDNAEIETVDIFPSLIKVTCMSYKSADALLDEAHPEISALYALASKILTRRLSNGAVVIDFPEVDVRVDRLTKTVTLDAHAAYKTQALVRECMLLAGEGAAKWALQNNVPHPFISQDVDDAVHAITGTDYAASYKKRRLMMTRSLSNKPGSHKALGLSLYTQVTSPLRRYTDLLCHEQIRAFLRGAPLLSADAILAYLAEGERGAILTQRIERAATAHWKCVYLSDKIESVWDAVLLERRNPRSIVLIPALALETDIAVPDNIEVGSTFQVTLKKVDIAECAVTVSG